MSEISKLIGLANPPKVAARLGVTYSQFFHWMNGRPGLPEDFPKPFMQGKRRFFKGPEIEAWLVGQPLAETQPQSLVAPELPAAPAKRGPGRPRKVAPVGEV